jgi:hypothetical protein
MVLLRTVFQAKFGKADEVVAAMKEMSKVLPDEQVKALQPRVLTDISGPFDTVVMETTHESLAAIEEFRKAIFTRTEDSSEEPSAINSLIVSGRNEYYTIEL